MAEPGLLSGFQVTQEAALPTTWIPRRRVVIEVWLEVREAPAGAGAIDRAEPICLSIALAIFVQFLNGASVIMVEEHGCLLSNVAAPGWNGLD